MRETTLLWVMFLLGLVLAVLGTAGQALADQSPQADPPDPPDPTDQPDQDRPSDPTQPAQAVVNAAQTDETDRTDNEAEQGFDVDMSPDAPWLEAAQARIEKYRKSDLKIHVVDGQGNAVAGASVHVEMTSHAFPFGTAISAGLLADGSRSEHYTDEQLQTYRAKIANLFNRAAPANHLKWWPWQSKPEKQAVADRAVQWLLDHGLDVHAHVLIWDSRRWNVLPPDVQKTIDDEDMSLADKRAFLHKRSLEHIRKTAGRYRGKVTEWDVLNENYAQHAMVEAMYPQTPPEHGPILIDWFKAARKADPGARLYVNDYGILVGDQSKHKNAYERLIRFLKKHDAPIGGIGMQCHVLNKDQRRTPEQLMKTLDRFAQFDLPIQVTEFDMFPDGWADTEDQTEKMQGQYLRLFYTLMFSHPAISGITMWGFWDGRHWQNNAPLFRKDWSHKPGYDAYTDLVFHQWWTDQTANTDHAGHLTVRGFHGNYQVTVKHAGQTNTTKTTLEKPGTSLTVQLSE